MLWACGNSRLTVDIRENRPLPIERARRETSDQRHNSTVVLCMSRLRCALCASFIEIVC